MIHVYYSCFSKPLTPSAFTSFTDTMPEATRARILSYRRWQDAHACLLGRLLLLHAMTENGCNGTLNDVKYNNAGRPFLPGTPDFNITHSGTLVACAWSEEGNTGIDAEEVTKIDFLKMRSFFAPEEWKKITTAATPQLQFYKFWTQKEAILKAEGKGMTHCLSSLNTAATPVFYQGKYWHSKEIRLPGNYICHIACDTPGIVSTVQELIF
ncbi:4'-phosphopantetheinyl transferase family protein [Chitinophagaceae bacterium MMS25-I14]